jgi:hypothetical protein
VKPGWILAHDVHMSTSLWRKPMFLIFSAKHVNMLNNEWYQNDNIGARNVELLLWYKNIDCASTRITLHKPS